MVLMKYYLIVIPLIINRRIPNLIISIYIINYYSYSFSFNSSLSIPIYQDLFILMSSYFIKGPINLLEVMSCLNYCYNLYHIHYFNILFIIYLFMLFILLIEFI